MEAIDSHAHYFPVEVLKEIGRKDPRIATELAVNGNQITIKIGKVVYSGRVDKGYVNPDDIESETRRLGLSVRVLSYSPTSMFYELDAKLAEEACRKCNDFASDLAEKFKESAVSMSIVPLQDPESACDELQRSADMGLKGVEIGTNINGKNLDDPAFSVFFAKAEKLAVPVFIHPIFYVAGADRLRNYFLVNMVGNPVDTTLAAGSLIFGGIFEDHPKLKVILSHGGGFLPFQIGRFDHGFLNRPEPKKKIKKLPSEYLKNIYFDTITHNQNALKFMIKQVGSDHMLLGSDYPFDMGTNDPLGEVQSLDVDDEVKEAIRCENARDLFKL